MGEGVQDGNTDHMTPLSPDCMQFGIKMFSVPPTIVLHNWDDRYVLLVILTNFNIT